MRLDFGLFPKERITIKMISLKRLSFIFYTRNQRPDEGCALLGRQTRMVRAVWKRLRLHETKNKARCRLHDPHLTRTIQRVRDTAREVLAQIRA